MTIERLICLVNLNAKIPQSVLSISHDHPRFFYINIFKVYSNILIALRLLDFYDIKQRKHNKQIKVLLTENCAENCAL